MILEAILQAKLDELKNQAIENFSNNNFEKAVELLLKSWDLFPDPKETYNESYHISHYLIICYLKIENYEKAFYWAEILQDCGPERRDNGERVFIKATVAFEKGDLDMAKKLFTKVYNQSGDFIFNGKDERYLALIK